MPLPVRRRGVVAITTWCSRVVGRTHTRCSSSIGTAWLRRVWALDRYRRVVLRAIRPLPTLGQRDGKMAGGGEGHVVDARCRNSPPEERPAWGASERCRRERYHRPRPPCTKPAGVASRWETDGRSAVPG